MASFFGEYECKLDDKGRLVFPARIKASLPEDSDNKLTLVRGFEPCLTIYPQDEWEEIYNKVINLNPFNKEHRMFQRTFLRGCTEIELDKSGRFLIPRLMLRYAQLDKEAVLVGVGDRIEIWNPELYEDYLFTNEEEFSEIAEAVLGDKPQVLTFNTNESNQEQESNTSGGSIS